MIANLEGQLTDDDMHFTGGHLALALDFSSKVKPLKTFEKMIINVFSIFCFRKPLNQMIIGWNNDHYIEFYININFYSTYCIRDYLIS